MNQSWYIYGAGGLGMETMDILSPLLNSDTDLKASYLVDSKESEFVNGTEVIDFSEELTGFVTIAVGEPATRVKLFERLKKSSLKLRSIISKDAFVSEFTSIGDGCIIAPMCSIQATAVIKDNVAVNTAAIVGHDVVIDESAVISSQVNLGGGVTVGRESYIGMGALVKEGVKIGNNVIIGMGSVVYKDIPDGVIAIGNPARPLKKNIDQKVFG
ncbi:Putative acetyltransferase EpsM [Marinomonas spartinae]|uniref:NeuD/PglB/VioB family sugar acetyltransferase n=1 Tax=Marinomonas spartinae TaxID=1792290 RepID=UPI000808F93C|nr:NeuD/PglB/VioB family sugar acetyltransferase [Marinomonas spartinae]SBS40435.1 Putative acetyltransferase EpsM [Marinomonas spartinae]